MRKFLILLICLFISSCTGEKENKDSFSFVITADMRGYTGDDDKYFRGVCEAISQFDGVQFMISPGDIDPPDTVLYTIRKYIPTDMVWYPVVGNHETETPSDMEWLRNYNKNGNSLPFIVNMGPIPCLETTYSFDYKNTHFVILNVYCNEACDTCSDGDIPDFLFNWLKKDLTMTKKENILVIGHEPAYPLPDIENQRFRHLHDCLNKYPVNRNRFVSLLQERNVTAYIFGHTHNYSIVKINKLWHIDVGQSRGIGDQGSRSTFVKININGNHLDYETYRLNLDNYKYEKADSADLN